MGEQRKTARRGFLKPLVLIDARITGYVEDLTREGCGLVVLCPLAVGQHLALTIRFHRHMHLPEIAVSGTVRWLSRLADDTIKAGLQFDPATIGTSGTILRYMHLASKVDLS